MVRDEMAVRVAVDGSGLRAALARARREALAGVQPRPVVNSALDSGSSTDR